MKLLLLVLFVTLTSYAQDGLFKTYYSSGKVESEITYVDRIRDGAAKFYYENGNLKQELTYVNGKVEGLVKEYYENGNLKQTYNIQDGRKEGPVSLYKEDGTYLSDIFYEKGKRVKDEVPVEDESFAQMDTSINVSAPAKDSVIATSQVIKKAEETKVQTETFTPPDSSPDTLTGYLTSADNMPEPHGGWVWLYKKLSYPREAREKKIEGTTKILAYIDGKGNVVDARIQEGFNPLCDEAARVTVMYTKFKPALVNGYEVKIKMIIPVEFKLQ